MVVAGVMSGTSADGVDVAVCRIGPGRSSGHGSSLPNLPKINVLGHASFPFSNALRAAVLRAMDAKVTSTAELAQLSWRLGEVYAECVEKTAERFGVKIGLVGCHGQTVYHQAGAAKYLGGPLRCTWQMGEASLIAERMRVAVVSDFRPADMAAGGEGAPLVPMLDYVLFRDAHKSLILLNMGGIANVTILPVDCGMGEVMAFDTGPANMVVDACMERLFGKKFDRGGAVARRGSVVAGVVERVMRERYFSALPPKSCGREEFGEAFTERFIAMCRRAGSSDADVVATATALTASSIVEAYRRLCWPHLGQLAPLAKGTELVAAGGGAKNATLMRMLREGLEPLGVKVRQMEELGLATEAKEAVAFALLAWLTWHRIPGNVPSATGAKRAVVLGKVTLV
jgi:anhydro-N-acetylmuramic acid kinase